MCPVDCAELVVVGGALKPSRQAASIMASSLSWTDSAAMKPALKKSPPFAISVLDLNRLDALPG